jgi:hypothetical protein
MESGERNFSAAVALATEPAPAPMAHQAVHDTVVRILQELPGGRQLDVPAGEGALAARLSEIGYEVLKWLIYGYTSHFRPLTREYVDRVRKEAGNKEEIALTREPD